MRFFTLVWRNLSRRRARSLLTVSGVAVAVVAVVALVGIANGLQRSLLGLLDERGIDLVVTRAGGARQSNSVLDQRIGNLIAELDNVRAVAGVLVDVVSFAREKLFGVTVQGYPRGSFFFDQLRIVDGRTFEPGDTRVVLLGKRLAESLGAQVGDEVDLLDGEMFHVLGIYESFNVFENGSLIMELAELQAMMGRRDEVTLFAVVTNRKDAESMEVLRQQVVGLTRGLDAMPAREYAENMPELRIAQSAAWLTSTVALVIGAIGTLNTMIMSVYDRTREFGVLRAIGWGRARILRLVLGESLMLGLGGAVVGAVLGVVAIWLLSRMPMAGRIVSGDIDVQVIGQGFAIALGVGALGGIYPAYRASRMAPTEALRHE